MKLKIKFLTPFIFVIPIIIFYFFNSLDIPKFFFLNFIDFLNSYKTLSVLFFVLFYTTSILLFLPLGIFFHIISGLVFGSFMGYFYSILAILIATTIGFYISNKNFVTFVQKKKDECSHYLKDLNLSNNELLNIFLLRLSFFIPISVQNILSAFITKSLMKLLFVTIITTSPPMLALIFSASKIRDNLNYEQFQIIDLSKIYIIIFLSLISIHLIRFLINLLIKKRKKISRFF